jgi:hypothetical protein
MASPILMCGNCGAQLSEGVAYCSRCGAKVDRSARRCEVCGHDNTHTRENCESCGAKLPVVSGSLVKAVELHTDTVPARQTKGGERRKKGRIIAPPKRAWEPWQIVAVGAIMIVVGFFVYTELKRGQPPSSSNIQDQSAALPPDMTVEIDRLQKVVNLNPADAASTLRLANLLHDNGPRDPQSVVRAVEMYKKYLALNPNNPDARVDLGVCYFELGRGDSTRSREYFMSATTEMGKAYAAHPTHQTAAFNLGIVNLYAGNLEAASKWFTRAVEIDASSTLGARAKQLLEQHSVKSSSQ